MLTGLSCAAFQEWKGGEGSREAYLKGKIDYEVYQKRNRDYRL